MNKRDIIAIDLFSGAGGFSLAAQDLGIEVLGAIEYDKNACKTYRTNFITNPIYNDKKSPCLFEGDINQLSPEKMIQEIGIKEGELDILMGGPPCQGFSSHRFKDSGVDDPRNKLLWRYFDFIKVIKPKTFIVENVRGMLWDKHENYVSTFYKLAEENGYKVHDPVILDAKDFGVPQNRKRVFILGIREDIEISPIWPPQKTHFPFNSESEPKWISAGTVFKKKLDKSDINSIHMKHGNVMIERFKQTPPNGGSRTDWDLPLDCHKNYAGHKDVYG